MKSKAPVDLAPGQKGIIITADCPAGQVATGGGGYAAEGSGATSLDFVVALSHPRYTGTQPKAWVFGGKNNSTGVVRVQAWQLCGPL
ncbi:hypothetical protein NX794_10635 [Streptomyces sp. LP11]|uniref:Uncharacterized protein n=1 Tax=Streptomyces pyxinicus TaxID=2970331 RepID=A0ABT2AZL6_9ACTN|nr:hypothetical protein [Streptomyces sp. LP11]MCS0601667.1 hypothetical protein [Streptomyces sp. LP11]